MAPNKKIPKDQPLVEADAADESLDNKDSTSNTPEITSEQPADTENIQKESSSLSTASQPKPMEVHHHTHTARKKFRHYAFEFFMLFLAVFCGFLAEYQLEHVIEHNREEQYMKSLVEDIETDTVMLHSVIRYANEKKRGIDSILELIYTNKYNDNVAPLYVLHIRHVRPLRVVFVDRTMQQLKNAGGMRLIRNHKVANDIATYWNRIDNILLTLEHYNTIRIGAKDISYKIFNSQYYDRLGNISNPIISGKPELMSKEKAVMNEYANRVRHSRDVIEDFYILSLVRALKHAEQLLALIKKEYHL